MSCWFNIKALVEYIVNFVVDHYGEESLVDYHIEESFVRCLDDLAVDHDAESIVNHDDDASIVDHSGDASYDIDHHLENSNGVCHSFEISNGVSRHIETLSRNDTKIIENCPTRCTDINILSARMGHGNS